MTNEVRSYRLKDLDTLTSEQLDSMLRVELDREDPDSKTVLKILEILEHRDQAEGVGNDVDLTAAWERYQQKVSAPQGIPKPKRWCMQLTAAVAAVVCAVLLLAPPVLGTENIFTLIGRWTDDIFKFVDPTSTATDPYDHYVFETDHPGLQQIYDAVIELGITEPVVPMWVPVGYVLKEMESTILRKDSRVYACLTSGTESITFFIKSFDRGTTTEYPKNDSNADVLELSGIEHYIIRNKYKQSAVWAVDDVVCCITVTAQDRALYEILQSIYRQR